MTSSECEEEHEADAKAELKFIADELAVNPEILGKSQIPAIKRKKDAAIEQICNKYAQLFGKTIKPAQLMKKINNMKTRLKKKTDMKKTGNRSIKLLEWEKVMYKAMECDTNPTAAKIPGAKCCGVTDSNQVTSEVTKEEATSSQKESRSGKRSASAQPLLIPPPRKTTLLGKSETDETKGLSNTELQRLVLLEQFKTTKLQGEYFRKKLLRLEQASGQQQSIAMEGGSSYLQL